MDAAQYVSCIARACPGLFTTYQTPTGHLRDGTFHIRYKLPQEQGWAYVMAHGISTGTRYTWGPDQDEAAQWEALKQRYGA